MQQCHKYPPTPLSGFKVRYSAHGPFFARLRYIRKCTTLEIFLHKGQRGLVFTNTQAMRHWIPWDQLLLVWLRFWLQHTFPLEQTEKSSPKVCVESSETTLQGTIVLLLMHQARQSGFTIYRPHPHAILGNSQKLISFFIILIITWPSTW